MAPGYEDDGDDAGDEIHPISPNPGGAVDPADHIGHQLEADHALRAAQGQGVLLTGDRRMGKTSLLNWVQEQLEAAGHVVVRLSAETAYFDQFATRLLDAIGSHSRFKDELAKWAFHVDAEKYGMRVVRTPADGSAAVDTSSDDLWTWSAKHAQPHRLIVILDEITVLAHEIHKANAGAGEEFLRGLKRARDQRDGPVMIFAGSIGIHHALSGKTVINDLQTVSIGPLKDNDAVHLARCLLRGAALGVTDEIRIAQAIAEVTDGIAYYIHHVVNTALVRGIELTVPQVGEIITSAIENPDDPWEFSHYVERLGTYYGDDAEVVGTALDAIATQSTPLTADELLAIVRSTERGAQVDRTTLVRLIGDLERDHYVVREGSGNRFASTLLRRAWIWNRRLA